MFLRGLSDDVPPTWITAIAASAEGQWKGAGRESWTVRTVLVIRDRHRGSAVPESGNWPGRSSKRHRRWPHPATPKLGHLQHSGRAHLDDFESLPDP